MVDIKIIEYVVGKCLTISSMKSRLSSMTQEEKNLQLQGRLTRLEWEDYVNTLNMYKETYDKYMGLIENGEIDEEKIPFVYKFLEEDFKEFYEDDLFKYERRIIEDYRIEEQSPPSVNRDDYVVDEDIPYDEDNMLDRSIIGSVENEMITYQEANYNLTSKEEYWIEAYYLDNYAPLKYRINHEYDLLGEYIHDDYELDEFNREFPLMLRHMDNAINKQEGLLHPTVLFHGGLVDPSLTVGSHGVWKNYISTSFQEISMKGHNKSNPDYWEIVIYAPKGTKGLCGNIHHNYGKDENGDIKWSDYDSMNQYTFEHEYLLGRNTGYTVIGMDYEHHRQIVVLD